MANDLPDGQIPKHELLLKMLRMTTSDNDNQALVAMRKANALLSANGWDWDKLLAGKITVVGDPFAGLSRPPEAAKPAPAPMQPSNAKGPLGSFNNPYPPRAQPAPQPQRSTWKPRAKPAGKPKVASLDDLGL